MNLTLFRLDPCLARCSSVIGALLLAFSFNAAVAEPLNCRLGQADFSSAQPTLAEYRARAESLKGPAKAKNEQGELARKQRLQIVLEVIETALKISAEGRDDAATAFWTFADRELADAKWRIAQEVKSGNEYVRWLALEQKNRSLAQPWPAQDCELIQNDSLGSALAVYRRAICLLTTRPDQSVSLMQQAADVGHPAAMEAVGRLCADQGEKGRACAVDWLCKASDAGRASAAGLAGFLLTANKPQPSDAVKAAALYEMAFKSGDAASANNLGEVYERGWIGRINLEQAKYWYRQAADKDLDQAKLNLARLLWRDPVEREQARALISSASLDLPAEAKQLLQDLEGVRD